MENKVLDEDKVVKFDGKTYPDFGWCVIVAGGAGSGKGYSYEHYIPIQGKKYDPDELKKKNLKTWHIERHETDPDMLVLSDGTKYSLESVYDPSMPDDEVYTLKNKKFTSLVHKIVNPQSKRFKNYIMTQKGAAEGRLPNVIFDLTMNEVSDYESIIPIMKSLKYKIVVVYVFTDFDNAMYQNSTRDRRVEDAIMYKTHKGMFEAFAAIRNRPDLIGMLDGVWVIMNDWRDTRVKVFDIKDGDSINIMDERIEDFIKKNMHLIYQREFEFNNKKIDEEFIAGNDYFDWS